MKTRTTGEQAKVKRACYAAHRWCDPISHALYLTCHICGGRINPATESWDADHILPVTLGGSDDPSNVKPAHPKCHRSKTSTDIRANAKCKRNKDKSMGIRRKGWSTKYRRKMDGTVELK